MNTYVWRRWHELDQLVRRMAFFSPSFHRRLSDAPPRAVHVYALVMRSEFWAALHDLAARYQRAGDDRARQIGILRDPDNDEILLGLANVLERQRLDDLLALAWPDAPPRLLQMLDRCGEEVHSPAFYEKLANVMRVPTLEAVLLAHREEISTHLLLELNAARGLGDLTMKACVERRLSPGHASLMQNFIDAVTDIHGSAAMPVFAAALAGWNAGKAEHHYDRLLLRLPVPTPPWNGTDRLKPVRSTAELKSIALRLRNCAADYRLHMILGYRAFYVWKAPDIIALLAINRQPDGSWALHEMKGPGNASVPAPVAEDIRMQLADAGISAKPSIARLISDLHIAQVHNFRNPAHFDD